jgi:hypothetical protein
LLTKKKEKKPDKRAGKKLKKKAFWNKLGGARLSRFLGKKLANKNFKNGKRPFDSAKAALRASYFLKTRRA